MKQCLSCNKPCAATAIFCDSCRSSLLNRQVKRGKSTQVLSTPVQNDNAKFFEQIQTHYQPRASLIEDPPPGTYLQEYLAAQRSKLLISEQDIASSRLASEASPELEDTESDDYESDDLMEQTDPLVTRRLPTTITAAHSEEEDTYPVEPEGKRITAPVPAFRRIRSRPLRVTFITLIVAITLVLIVDAVLIAFSSIHRGGVSISPSPVLAIIPNSAHPGQTVLLHISHFSSFTHVFLTRDIQETVQTDTGSPLILLGSTGSADVHIHIDNSWGPGSHTIEGEDVITHYTTSTVLQIIGAGQVEHAHLTIEQTSLAMGADLQGANTIQQFMLHNAGGSSISWAASSDQPWLMETPVRGVFTDKQSIAIAVTRANLKPGNYSGTLSIISNSNSPTTVHVTMTVLPLPAHAGAVLQVTPPALAFTSSDGGPNPTHQFLAVSNPGAQPLAWSYTGSAPMEPGNQNLPFKSNDNWLSTEQTAGLVAPGSTAPLGVLAHSQNLLQGVYIDILTLASAGGLNNPQRVAISLTVQPRLPINPTPGTQSTGSASPAPGTPTSTTSPPGEPILDVPMSNLTFIYTQGQNNPANQEVALSNVGGSAFSWQASIVPSTSSWLSIDVSQGSVAAGQSGGIEVSVNAVQLAPGKYKAQLIVYASDSSGVQLQNSPQTLTITLNVFAPCSLQVTPSNLTFTTTLILEPNPPGQSITFKEEGNCVQTVTWSAAANRNWLTFSNTNGSGNGSITVSVNAQGMLPGTYSGQITLSAKGNVKNSILVNPQTISVTMKVSA